MRISDWSSDVCSSDLRSLERGEAIEDRGHHHEPQCCVVADLVPGAVERQQRIGRGDPGWHQQHHREGHAQRLHPLRKCGVVEVVRTRPRSEEHTSELQSLMRISYAVFCLKKKKRQVITNNTQK